MNTHTSLSMNRLHLKIADGIQFVRYNDIIRFEAQRKHILVFVNSVAEPYKVTGKMDDFEEFLDKSEFFRCHRSHIINIQYIQKYVSKGNQLVTSRGTVPLAESKLNLFKVSILKKIVKANRNSV